MRIKPHHILFGLAILLIGGGIFIYTQLIGPHAIRFNDAANGVAIPLPADTVNLADGKQLTRDYHSDGSRFQFTLSQYPFTGPDTSPYFDVTVAGPDEFVDITAATTIAEFMTSHVRTLPRLSDSQVTTIGEWSVLCSGETPARLCVAVAKLSNGKLIELSYDVQKSTDASDAFWSAFHDMMTSAKLVIVR